MTDEQEDKHLVEFYKKYERIRKAISQDRKNSSTLNELGKEAEALEKALEDVNNKRRAIVKQITTEYDDVLNKAYQELMEKQNNV